MMRPDSPFQWKDEYYLRVVLGGIGLFLFLLFTVKECRMHQKVKRPIEIVNRSTVLNGRILFARRHRIESEIILSSSDTLFISGAVNLSYKDSEIQDFLEIADSLTKVAGNDTILVFRKNAKYVFVLGRQVTIPTELTR